MKKAYTLLLIISIILFGTLLKYQVLKNIANQNQYITITIKNGETILQFIKRMEHRKIATKKNFLKVINNNSLIEYPFIPQHISNLIKFEGIFIPGNYKIRFTKNSNALNILQTLLSNSQKRFQPIKTESNFNLYSSLILASIVEKESVNNHNYQQIAAVFYNRLSRKQILGSCPTVEYALGYHRPFLTFNDLKIKSPYNVYRRLGLPPTPICFFSDEAYVAVINPIKSDNYFFVYDWTTDHFSFSSTIEEHLNKSAIVKNNFLKIYPKELLHKRFDRVYYEQPPEMKKYRKRSL